MAFDNDDKVAKRNDTDTGCKRNIKKKVSVAVQVEIKPQVKVKKSEIEIECVGRAKIKRKKKKCRKKEKCKFYVLQDVFVSIPIHFGADTEVKPLGIICDSEQCIEENKINR